MTWVIQPYRTVLEAFCAQFRAARNADRNSVLDEIVKELREVEAREGGMKRPLPDGLQKVFTAMPYNSHFLIIFAL